MHLCKLCFPNAIELGTIGCVVVAELNDKYILLFDDGHQASLFYVFDETPKSVDWDNYSWDELEAWMDYVNSIDLGLDLHNSHRLISSLLPQWDVEVDGNLDYWFFAKVGQLVSETL